MKMETTAAKSRRLNLIRAAELAQAGFSLSERKDALIHIQSATEGLMRHYLSVGSTVPKRVRRQAQSRLSYRALVQEMQSHGDPPLASEDANELIELNKLRVAVAHPGQPVSIENDRLDQMLQLAKMLFKSYDSDIESEEAMEYNTPFVIFESSRFHRYPSTLERRLVLIHKGAPVRVFPVGKHWINPLTSDSVAFVTMTARRLPSSVTGEVTCRDGVPVACESVVEVSIRDDEVSLRAAVIASPEAERIVLDALISSLQQVCARKTFTECRLGLEEVEAECLSLLESRLAGNGSLFSARDLFLREFSPADDELGRAALEVAQTQQRHEAEILGTRLEHQRFRETMKANEERLALEGSAKVEQLKYEHTEHIARLQSETAQMEAAKEKQKLELEASNAAEVAKLDLELKRAKAEAEMAVQEMIQRASASKELGSDEAKMATFPTEFWQLKLQEAKQSTELEKYKAQTQFELNRRLVNQYIGIMQGQNSSLRALAEGTYNLRIETPSLPAFNDDTEVVPGNAEGDDKVQTPVESASEDEDALQESPP